ncbi:plastid-lipid-associated protein 6, chloroplastic isoform X2 [Durio zibethinus]|uniref:Plastid-lipid-associated protein 6, chloroplastic isoform X2 n=1 Tax=Durio zibethinus TaxID=66656 RepID=A0A6P5Z948_DURZI|nr:plastid-lipid-associated protein 6, chloroplastic isoform X2 [Durio zibethinus]
MASLSSLIEIPTSIFSSSSINNSLYPQKGFPFLVKVNRLPQRKRSFVLKSAVDESAVSGVNKGLAASEDDLRKADAAAKELEAVAGPVDLSTDLDKLQGRWKLIYSSAFSSRTLGGSRPGPPIGRLLPITLGQVFQRIDVLSKDFDNIVDLEVGAPWPLPPLPLPPLQVTATLAHKFELLGAAKIKITFEKTTVKTKGNLSQLPPLEVPQIPDALRPPSNTGSGEFEVTFVDADTRITRGDRGELRVFVIS